MATTSLSREPWKLTATEAANAVRIKKISVSELASSCLKRIDQIENQIGAWAFLEHELILQQAQALDQRLARGVTCGDLCGVPIGVKDIFNTSDMPTCMGSPIWKDFTPGNDARVVFELRQADAVVMGKTVTAEFAVHYPGKTVNPFNPKHTPGTSSSGSAAAVAACMVPLALGTQTAGSTIRPASYCGIYGYKPSFGLIPRTGVLKTLDTLDHVTFFARGVDDVILFLNTIRVKGRNYPYVHEKLEDESKQKKSGKVWRVGFVKTPVWSYAEKYVQNDLITFLKNLDSLPDVHVDEVELPDIFSKAHDIHQIIYTKALSYYFKEEYEKHYESVSHIMRDMIEQGQKISHDKYLQSLRLQNELSGILDQFCSQYDVVLSHSTAGEAPEGLHTIEKKDPCLIWTLCRVPSMNLPIFKSPKGLPFGAQMIGQRYCDYRLLAFARHLYSLGVLPKAPYPSLNY